MPNRMLMAAVIIGILALSCYMASVKLTTERVVIPVNNGKGKSNPRKTIKGLGEK